MLSPDGHRLYFESMPFAGNHYDVYVSRRHDKKDDLWGPPVNVGLDGGTPSFFEDENTGILMAYFVSSRNGNSDIYSTWVREDGTFAEPAVPVHELNTIYSEGGLTVRKDGLENLL